MANVRVSLALDDPALTWSPTWTDITATPNLVASYEIDRGRQYEFDRTDTGTARIFINDQHGELDPNNSSSPLYGKVEPLLGVLIELYDPVAAAWSTRFRGFVEDYDYRVDPSEQVTFLELSCVDLFELLSAILMDPASFGDPPPNKDVAAQGAWFDCIHTIGGTQYAIDPQARINQVWGNAGIDTNFLVAFTGNVQLSAASYSSDSTVLDVIGDCADAEFPTVSNVYVDRTGRLCFHGRLAKFDPAGVAAGAGAGAWDFTQWKAGDAAAVAASPSDTAQIRTFAFNRGVSKVFNQALCTPDGMQGDISGQYAKDLTSIGTYGIRSWSAEGLRVLYGLLTGNDAKTECQLFAQYIVANYATPRDRISSITFRTMDPADPRAAANWALICGCDIADAMDVTVTTPGGGGFNLDPHFIEGVHETAGPATGAYADVTLTLDLSPQAYFTNPVGLNGT